MLLNSLEIKNFRSLENVKLDNLKQFNVLIGRNNAGKSTVFLALYELNNVLKGQGIQTNVLTDQDNKRSLEIKLTFKPQQHEREELINILIAQGLDIQRKATILNSSMFRMIQFFFKSPGGNYALLYLRETRILAEDGEWTTVQRMTGNENLGNPEQKYVHISAVINGNAHETPITAQLLDIDKTSHHSSTNVGYNEITTTSWASDLITSWIFTQLRRYFTEAFFFNPFRHSTPILAAAQTEVLAQDGLNLAQVLHTLIANDRDTFEEIERFIHGALPDLGKMQTPLINSTTNIVFRSLDKTYRIPLTDMGGGIEQLLMVATVLLTPRTLKHTLFLEEPESHLHAGAQRYLIEKLYDGERQVFITTHSPTFINLLKPVGLYQVLNVKGCTTVKQCNTNSFGSVLEDIGVRNSDVLLSDAVLFVEGSGDIKVLTIFSETLGMSVAEYNVNILPMNGARDIQRSAPIRSDLLSAISAKATVPHMFLIDRDERCEEDIQALISKLGEKLHILQFRGLENYLLIPRAILKALKAKHYQDSIFLERLTAFTEEQVKQYIEQAADNLYDRVLIKRIRARVGGLQEGLLPEKSITKLLAEAKNPELPHLVLQEITKHFTQHITNRDIETLVKTEIDKLNAQWTDKAVHLHLAQGEEILQSVFHALGSTYNKDNDTPQIARAMLANEIHSEIVSLLEKIRALSSQ